MKLKDLSKELNISISTISRVLSNDQNLKVKEETRNVIIETAIKNGYKFKNNINDVLIVTSYKKQVESDDPYYLTLRNLIEKELVKNHFNFRVVEYSSFISFKKYNIFLGSFNDEQLENIRNNKKINILCDSFTNKENIDCVSFDYKHSVYTVLDTFINKGHTNIGFIGGKDNNSKLDFREEYFRKYMKDTNLLNDDYIYIDNFNSKTGYDGVKKIFKKKINPTALFVANDSIAMGCYKALKEMKKKIPSEVSIIGFNNSEFSEFMIPPLSSVQIFINHIVKESVLLLLEHSESKRKYSKKIILNTKLLLRESV
ncbi:LacI family DNA-binding transcriptional regulator [Streptobacillus felis]|uniref:LacI family DNA-binding transcriptional regulator n=1 Tax=Streptobacillus felis TaxID=1384509 RepID=A0A7Z0TAC0_9FUSO|nr:LacI family DNA-binding transcriptional regulator [Streptobacillus felis]NYV27847.1 LacI family DNA-binding transcriptional regulator [Streptobacillus felis]